MQDEDQEVRCTAAWTLGQMGDRQAVEPLITTLEDKEPEVVLWAAYALGQIGDGRALSYLEQIAKEDHRETRYGAKLADIAKQAIEWINAAQKRES